MRRAAVTSDDWVLEKLLPGKPGMPTERKNVKRLRKSSKWRTKKEVINGKRVVLVYTPDLPPETRREWMLERAKALMPPHPDLPAKSSFEVFNMLPEIPDYNRKKYESIRGSLELTKGLNGNELKDFIMVYNSKNPDTPLHSYPSIMRFRDIVRERGYEPLIGKYGDRAGKTTVTEEWGDYFWSHYGSQNKLSMNHCHRLCMNHFCSTPEEKSSYPSVDAFARYIVNRYGISGIYMAREGQKKWDDRFGSYISRSYDDLAAGYCWDSDHAQIDVMVIGSQGKPVCLWLTSWGDTKTGKTLGWMLHEEPPNSDHIFHAFYIAAQKYGIPREIIIDNGKDYRVHDFAGGRKQRLGIDEKHISSLCKSAGITCHFTIPYNAKAKPRERIHLKIKEWFSKMCVGYRGGNPKERPEKLKDEIKKGLLMTADEFITHFDDFILNVLNKMPNNGKVLQGMSPDEAWYKENPTLLKPRPESLALICARRSKLRRIGRNGIEDSQLGVTYYGEWMHGMDGGKVSIRRLPNDTEVVWCFDENDGYVGKAQVMRDTPVLVHSEEDSHLLSEEMARTKSKSKRIKAVIASVKDKPYVYHLNKGDAFHKAAGIAPKTKVAAMVAPDADQAIEQAKKDERTHVGPRVNDLWRLQMRRDKALKDLDYQENLAVLTDLEFKYREANKERLRKAIDELDSQIAACKQGTAAAGN